MNTNNIRLINAERLLDMTTTEALDYIESGDADFDIETFKDELINQIDLLNSLKLSSINVIISYSSS